MTASKLFLLISASFVCQSQYSVRDCSGSRPELECRSNPSCRTHHPTFFFFHRPARVMAGLRFSFIGSTKSTHRLREARNGRTDNPEFLKDDPRFACLPNSSYHTRLPHSPSPHHTHPLTTSIECYASQCFLSKDVIVNKREPWQAPSPTRI